MKLFRVAVLFLLAALAVSSLAGQRLPRTEPIVIPPPCDVSKLIDLLDEWYAPASTLPLPPEYCAPRTCELQAQAIKATKDAKLSQDIDLMRLACRPYFP